MNDQKKSPGFGKKNLNSRWRFSDRISLKYDLLVTLLLALAGFIVSVYFNLFDLLYSATQKYEGFQIDEIFCAMIVSALAFLCFFAIRGRKLDRENKKRVELEDELRKARNELGEKVKDQTKELNATAEQLQKITSTMPAMVYQIRFVNGGSPQFTFISEGVKKVYELTRDEVIEHASRLYEQVHPEDRLKTEQISFDAFQSKSRWELEFRIITPSGQVKWIKGSADPQKLPDGTYAWNGVSIDITPLKQAEEQIKTLYDLGKKVTSIISEDELLPWIANQAKKLLDADSCNFRIREGGFLVRAAGTKEGALIMRKKRLKIGESLSGWVAKEKKPLIIDDLHEDHMHIKEHRAIAKKQGFRSFLGFPMMFENNIIGVICLNSKKQKHFNEKDVELLSSFADQAAMALENARLFENLDKAKKKIQKSERNLREFSRKLLTVREEEKKKLSIELHDQVGSLAVALNASLGIAGKNIEENRIDEALENIKKSRFLLENSAENLKNIAVELRPPELDIIGLPDALKEYFLEVQKQWKIVINFSTSINREKIDNNTAIVLYRVAQEALNNIIKHSDAKKVIIRLDDDDDNHIHFEIKDNGKGFHIKELSRKVEITKMGIIGMRERVESVEGAFTIKSSPKKGTHIIITIPLRTGAET